MVLATFLTLFLKIMVVRLMILIFSIGVFSCIKEVDFNSLKNYDGPISQSTNVLVIHSDSSIVRMELIAPKQLEFMNGNQTFPDGIKIKFYTKDGILESSIEADRGYFFSKETLYKAEGGVIVENFPDAQSLKSEELFWDKVAKIIYTNKFVVVKDK